MSSVAKKIIIAVVVVVLIVIAASLGVTIYGWRAAVREGNRAATILNLRTISAVEFQYFSSHNPKSFATFDQLVKEQLLTDKFAGNPVTTDGYVFGLTLATPVKSGMWSFTITADPQNAGNDHFYLDSTDGAIHVNPTKPAGPSDPILN